MQRMLWRPPKKFNVRWSSLVGSEIRRNTMYFTIGWHGNFWIRFRYWQIGSYNQHLEEPSCACTSDNYLIGGVFKHVVVVFISAWRDDPIWLKRNSSCTLRCLDSDEPIRQWFPVLSRRGLPYSDLICKEKTLGKQHPPPTSHWHRLKKLRTLNNKELGGGFKDVLFSSLPGEMIQCDKYFSDGLKPPTRKALDLLISKIPDPRKSMKHWNKSPPKISCKKSFDTNMAPENGWNTSFLSG